MMQTKDRQQRAHQRVAGDRLGRRRGLGEADGVDLVGLVGAEAAALDQQPPERAADHRGDDEAEGRHGDADLRRAGQAARGELGRPGDDRAVAAEQRGRAEHHRHAERQPGDPGAERADEVLQEQEPGGDDDEDRQRPAAAQQVADPGVEADAGEEDQQQEVAGVGVEADLDDAGLVEREEQQRDEQAAGDRVGDVEAAQDRRRGG